MVDSKRTSPPPRLSRPSLAVCGRSGQCFDTAAESRVPSAAQVAEAGLRRPQAVGQTSEAGGWEGWLRGRPPLRFCHAQDRDDGRGLYPPPEEHGPALAASMTIERRWKARKILQEFARSTSFRNRRWTAALLAGGRTRARARAARATGGARAAPRSPGAAGTAAPAVRPARAPGRRVICSCAARLVRTRFAWSAFASRFARDFVSRHDGLLLEDEREIARAGQRRARPRSRPPLSRRRPHGGRGR